MNDYNAPSLQEHHAANFNTMLKAAKHGDLALVSCLDAETGEPVAAICMVNRHEDGDYSFVPVARMIEGNPYEQLVPPKIEEALQ